MNLKEAFSVKGYDQLDLYYQESNIRDVILENNKLKNFECDFTKGVGVRTIVNGKIGFAYTTNPKKLIETVKQAIKLAKFSNQKVNLKSYPSYKKPLRIFDKKIIDINDESLINSVQGAISFVKENKAILTGGGLNLAEGTTKYLNSEGLELEEKSTHFSTAIDVNYKGVEAGWSEDSRKYEEKIRSVAQRALELAKQMSVKGKIKTGKHDVIFHPFAFQEILEYGLYSSFNADFVQKGKSKLAGKIGKKVFDEKLTIYDNGLLAGGLSSSAFDGDGTPSQNTLLVKDGILKDYLYDLVRAQKENRESTGNAARSYASLPAISVTNFQISPGKTKDVISEVDKGLLLYQSLNPHSVNPITSDFSLGAIMALWIENGEIKFAPKNIMLAGNIFELFNNIKLIGKDVMQVESLVAPSIVAQTQIIGD